jgi:hypothetical protein
MGDLSARLELFDQLLEGQEPDLDHPISGDDEPIMQLAYRYTDHTTCIPVRSSLLERDSRNRLVIRDRPGLDNLLAAVVAEGHLDVPAHDRGERT